MSQECHHPSQLHAGAPVPTFETAAMETDDPIHAFLNSMDDEEQEATDLNNQTTNGFAEPQSVACCCADASCVYLQHNQTALGKLEREVCAAGRLGKALLVRHESYVKDSERDREAMTMKIEALESDKLALEQHNSAVVEQNRSLLDQLEALNDAIIESDNQVTNLQATLSASQQELHRLSQLAARTAKLDAQIADFEREQAAWQSSLTDKDQSEKTAVRRWQQAERTLADMQRQIEAIEVEAKQERDRHAEVVGRMERRHAVERELHSSAARLKGAAAVKTAGNGTQGATVVSHFVRDLLQDNNSLQRGILELREMLDNSNTQVESLRKQLSDHQTLDADQTASPILVERPHLKEEMRRATAQELHVHHHYHANVPAVSKPGTIRRPKKKRYGALSSGHSNFASGTSTPRSSISYSASASDAAILSQTAASLPEAYQSMRAFSGPSSPQSNYRASSVFDNVFSDAGLDSSRPTTPGTEEPGSPLIFATHSKRSSASSIQFRGRSSGHKSRPSLDAIVDESIDDLLSLDQQLPTEAIPEEDLDWENSSSNVAEESSAASNLSEEPDLRIYHNKPLRRANSHDSLLSISGMDIHTLRSKPSQLLTPYGGRSFTSHAVLTEATAHASRPATMAKSSNSSQSILHGVAAERLRSGAPKAGIGNKIGWVFGKWGATPSPQANTPTAVAEPAQSIASGSDGKSIEEPSQDTPKPQRLRSFGVNQTGPIPFLPPEVKLPPRPPVMSLLDQDGLKRVLDSE